MWRRRRGILLKNDEDFEAERPPFAGRSKSSGGIETVPALFRLTPDTARSSAALAKYTEQIEINL